MNWPERFTATLHDRIAPLRAACTSPLRAVIFGLALTSAAAIVRIAIDDPTPRFITFYPAVALAALLGGPVSGIAATFSSAAIALALFFAEGRFVATSSHHDALAMANFVFTGSLISLVAAVDRFAVARDRRRADRALAESEALHRSTTEALQVGILVFSSSGALVFHNPAAETILEKTRTELASDDRLRTWKLLHRDGRPMAPEDAPPNRVRRDGVTVHDEVLGIAWPDRVKWLLLNAAPVLEPTSGSVTAVVMSFSDITERLAIERDLAESRARFASIVATAMDAIVSVDEHESIVLFNAAAERMFGYTQAEAIGLPLKELIPERLRARHAEGFSRFSSGPATSRRMGSGRRMTARRRDGSEFPIEASISRVEIDGHPLYTVIHRDITERLAAEKANARFATLVDCASTAIFTIDRERRFETWNPAAARLLGYSTEDVVGRDANMLAYPDDPNDGRANFERAMAGEIVRSEGRRRRADGSPIEVAWSAAAVRDAEGDPTGVVVVMADIGDRLSRQRKLNERENEQRQTLDAAGLGVWRIDLATREIHTDARARTFLEIEEPAPLEKAAERIHPEDRPLLLSLPDELHEVDGDRSLTLRIRSPEGGLLWLRATARRRISQDGLPEIWGTFQDITEQKTAEQALQQIEANRRLEALGRMTGGIAHDFNNLLTVISGNLQLLELSVQDEDAHRWITEALRATETGSALTGKLTTFARRRSLAPVVVDLNERIGSMLDLVHRSVGPSISVGAHFAPDLWPVRVDPTEIENALLNLAFNSRDALPEGGRILVETANVELDGSTYRGDAPARSGSFVRLSVCDDGVGMSAEVRARAFEPFFTTKQSGRGTGLGLATLHGFVRQSGGFVSLYSEPGHGTTVNVYLPRADRDEQQPATPPPFELPRGNGRRLLLVEDDVDVTRVTLERLTAFGWSVDHASSAPEALALVQAGRHWDLVFTDIMMPGGMTGLDLARTLRAADPDCRILLTSGFSEEIARGGGPDGTEFPLLRKPYTLAELMCAVDEAIRVAPEEIRR